MLSKAAIIPALNDGIKPLAQLGDRGLRERRAAQLLGDFRHVPGGHAVHEKLRQAS